MLQTIVQDEDTQKKGIVALLYFVGKHASAVGLHLVKSLYRIRLAVPHRLEAMHLCYDNKELRPFVSGFRFFIGKRARMRCRVHFGNEEHLLFQLQTFGIPISDDSRFKQVDGDFPTTAHEEWLQIRQAREMEAAQANDEKPLIVLPHRFDVLFGRGTNVRSHTGNLRALHLVNMWQSRYDGASNRFAKADISERIVGIIQESGGRFLKWDETGWMEVDDESARDKVSHWFRNQRRSKVDKDGNKTKAAPKRSRSRTETKS